MRAGIWWSRLVLLAAEEISPTFVTERTIVYTPSVANMPQQIERILQINEMRTVTKEVVEVARETHQDPAVCGILALSRVRRCAGIASTCLRSVRERSDMYHRHVRPCFVRAARWGGSMAEGSIKTITERGFGFIRPDTGRDDIFFHQSALVGVTMDQLRQGDHVTYTAEQDPRGKGMRASVVRLARE
jgi:cold shock protein